jgi:polysaccharide export outer membrane protein
LLAAAAGEVFGETPAGASEYRVGPRDLIGIAVYEVPDLNVRQRVSENGSISLPFIGEVRVEGLTQAQLAAELKRLLEAEYVERATVTVELLELRSRPISVLGAVGRPGDLAFSGQWTLLEAIAASGGLAENHGDAIHVLRRAGNGLSDQITVSADRLLARADPDVNVPLFSGDLVTVERMVPATIYFIGEVKSPGALEFRGNERITFLAAIARAGGLTDRASPKVVVRRRAPGGGTEELTVLYKQVLAGGEPDLELQDGDIVVVKESFF